jgi:hypothetical protein
LAKVAVALRAKDTTNADLIAIKPKMVKTNDWRQDSRIGKRNK